MSVDDIYQEYLDKRAKIKQMGGAKLIEKQHKEGKWTARERIDYFFDPGTFTELGLYVKHRATVFGMDKREIPAEGIIVGYGKVNGRYVAVASQDYTAMSGTFGEYHGKKFSQAIDFAKEKNIPFVGMNDSGGIRLQEMIDASHAYAQLFCSQISASGVIPQIALLMGPCFGGQAYHLIMQDFLIQCRKTGFLGIAGPAFVKTQIYEEISLEELCGVKVHTVKSGQTHLVAEDDTDCLDKAKELLSFLPDNSDERPPRHQSEDPPERLIPELDILVPEEPYRAFDMHQVLEKVVDSGYFFELMKDYAKNVIIGFARFGGRPVGIVASQSMWAAGGLDCDAADKIARFVRFCDLFNIPLVNFHDTPGYWIGSKEEWRGILRHGAKMLYAYIEATVPKITIMVRKSFAGAHTGMCCKDTGADFVFAWPIAQIGGVGAKTAASVIYAKEIRLAENPEEVAKKRIDELHQFFENPYRAAERGYIDDVIMPNETRKYINQALDLLENKTVVQPRKKYSNINL